MGGGFVCYDPPSHCKPPSCLIPNACDRSESSILELGAKKKEDVASLERSRTTLKIINLKIANKRKELDQQVEALMEEILNATSENEAPKKRRTQKSGEVKREERISFLLVNIRSLRNKINSAKLFIQVDKSKPDVILITETWLDNSTEEVKIPGYRSIARRDRPGDKSGGGVDVFVRDDFFNVGLFAVSETSERSWVTLHTTTGPILVGVWYRPPDEAREELQTLADELDRFSPGHIGVFLFCDANVHHQRWLRFSSEKNTCVGQDLKDICDAAGLKQLVREPTRKKNLLDLVLTTMHDIAKVTVLGSISDHRAVLCEAKLELPTCIEIEREVWDYRRADWTGLKEALGAFDWKPLMEESVDTHAKNLTERILEISQQFIPRRKIKHRKMSHPWLTRECQELTEAKNKIEQQLLEAICSDEQECTEQLEQELAYAIKSTNDKIKEAYEIYVEEVREEIKSLPKGSKKW